VGIAASGATSAIGTLKTQIKSFTESATVFEAPGEVTIEFKQGGGAILLEPDGEVGDRRIGIPPWDVTFELEVTDPDGEQVKVERNTSPRQPGAPIELLGVFEIEKDGPHRVAVRTSNDSPAAIMVGAGTEAEVKSLFESIIAFAQGVLSSCFSACGCLMALAFGVPALVLSRARRQPDPLEQM